MPYVEKQKVGEVYHETYHLTRWDKFKIRAAKGLKIIGGATIAAGVVFVITR